MNTRSDTLICVGSTVTRTGHSFRVKRYCVRFSDHASLLDGRPLVRLCCVSIDDGSRRFFRPRSSVAAYRALLAAHAETQQAHIHGARQMVADQPLG